MPVPDVGYRVEIAWGSTWRTPAASRVWTDVSQYVELNEGMSINYGRSDELSIADANTLTLTFDNSDGRFTLNNAASPYYPNVKIGRPIRVTALIGPSEYVRFVGNVDSWPVTWPGDSPGYAQATVTASSRMARLGLASEMPAGLDRAHELTGPTHYWRILEATGSAVASDYFNPSTPMRRTGNTVTFGLGETTDTDPAPANGLQLADGRVAAKFTRDPSGYFGAVGGEMRAINLTEQVIAPGFPGVGVSVSVFARITEATATPLSASTVFAQMGDSYGVRFRLNGARLLLPSGTDIGVAYPSSLLNDTLPHHHLATVSSDGTTVTLSVYLDGSLIGTATAPVEIMGFGAVTLRQPNDATNYRDMSMGRVATWNRALTAAEVWDLTIAGIYGYLADSTPERFLRYARWMSIPDGEAIYTPTGGVGIFLSDVPVEGKKGIELMRDVETTEAGVLHDDRDGNLILRSRTARYGIDPALTIPFSGHRITGYAPKADRQGLVNIGKGKNLSGTIEVTYIDEDSREMYGDADYPIETASLDPDEPLQLITWRILADREPRPRAPSASLNVLDWLGAPDLPVNLPALMALDVGSKVRFTDGPAQAPSASTVDYFVEGYKEEMNVGRWSVDLNLSPSAPHGQALRLDDATNGVLDTNILAL